MLAINRVNVHGLQFYIRQVATDSKQSLVRCKKDNVMKEMIMNYSIHDINSSWHKWTNQGHFIQDAFSYMTAEEREFLLTGLTPKDWDAIFPTSGEVTYDDGHIQMALPFAETPYDELKSDKGKGNE
jgi:hypothetical protein